jgi:hypothetical protein
MPKKEKWYITAITLLVLSSIFFAFLYFGTRSQHYGLSDTDNYKIEKYDNLEKIFGKNSSEARPVPFDVTIPEDSYAQACIDAFKDTMQSHGFNYLDYGSTLPGSLSTSISFKAQSLINFINNAADSGALGIDVRFGVYTPNFIAKYGTHVVADSLHQVGRITTFLYPYYSISANGKPNYPNPRHLTIENQTPGSGGGGDSAFNLGSIHP